MIEEKISQLTPDQQREVEDFIDFLITRDSNAIHRPQDNKSYDNSSRVRETIVQPAPLIDADERPVAGRTEQDILPDYPEYGGSGITGKTAEHQRRVVAPRRVEQGSGGLVDWID